MFISIEAQSIATDVMTADDWDAVKCSRRIAVLAAAMLASPRHEVTDGSTTPVCR